MAACSSPGGGSSGAGTNVATTASTLTLPSGYVRLGHVASSLSRAQLDHGVSDPTQMATGSVYLKLSDAQKADRDALLLAQQDPASPSYHRWLTPADYSARFGATTATVSAVRSFLASSGLQVSGVSPLGTRVAFRGTRDQVQRTFRTEIHDYVFGDKTRTAISTAPAMPAELASAVLGVKGLDGVRPHSRLKRPSFTPAPQYEVDKTTALGPGDFQVLYDTQPLITAGNDGTGVNIAIVGQTYYDPGDLTTFLQTFSLTNRVKDVLVPGTGAQHVLSADEQGEANLDVEWASATAPGANVLFVYVGADAANFLYSVDDAAQYIIDQGTNLAPGTGNGGAQVLSESYGGCEPEEPDNPDIVSEISVQANLEGITYLAASGDEGAAGCSDVGFGGLWVDVPASMPGVTGVGGTEFPQTAQVTPFFVNHVAAQYPQTGTTSLEAVWGEITTNAMTSEGAGGGGSSAIFPKPFYQQGLTPADSARDVPDVSLTASPDLVPYYTVEEGKAEAVGGTSASTPAFAGIVAILNQAVKTAGGSFGLGNINPTLYALAKSHPDVFHDIVTGDNDAPCIPGKDDQCPANGDYGGFSAGAGYDRATGLGSVDAAKLVAAWTAQKPTTTTISASATSTVVNTPISLSAHVVATGSTPLSGTVSFVFYTLNGSAGPVYAPTGGGFDESWDLGDVAITASGTTGDAKLTTVIPPGKTGAAFVAALYSGDAANLASQSTATPVNVTGSTLAISPASLTLRPNEETTLTATGGAPPVIWAVYDDTSCTVTGGMPNCSGIEGEDEIHAFFAAGPQPGTATVLAIDTNGEEALATVTIAGLGVDAGTFPTFDAGPLGGPGYPYVPVPDAGPVTRTADAGAGGGTGAGGTSPSEDAGLDAGTSGSGQSSSSGGCAVGSSPEGSAPGAGSFLLFLGAALVVRRRKS